MSRHILFVDPYDSFANNVVGLLETTVDVQVTAIHHDDPRGADPAGLAAFLAGFDAVLVGPGPGHPAKTEDIGLIGRLWQLWKEDEEHIVPMLGVCLGMQSLALAYGAAIHTLQQPRHGIVTRVHHDNQDIFAGTGKDWRATNYHSLHVVLPPHSDVLVPLAWDLDDEQGNGPVLMAIRHSAMPFWGVQFHPESECTTRAAARTLVANWWNAADHWLCQQGRRPRHGNSASVSVSMPVSMSSTSMHLPESFLSLNEPTNVKWNEKTRRMAKKHDVVISPTHLYEELIRDEDCKTVILLDSQNHTRGRYSILGRGRSYITRLTYYTKDRVLCTGIGTDETSWERHPLASMETVWSLLQEQLRTFQSEPVEYQAQEGLVPFWGGWMGYVSYEAGLETIDVSLPLPEECGHPQQPADVNMAFVYRSVMVDHEECSLVVQSLRPHDEDWIERTGRVVRRLAGESEQQQKRRQAKDSSDDAALQRQLQHCTVETPEAEEYCAKVATCQASLAAGDSYELCLTDECILLPQPAITIDPWLLYKRLRSRNAAPFGAYLQLAGTTVVSSSPEQFLSWTRRGRGSSGSRAMFRPIKGTVPKTPSTTRAQAQAILESSKEQAENLMIVDLIRHDLTGIVGAAQCRVTECMVVEEYETVYQLVSAIEGDLDPSVSGLDVLRASMPPGSMTGAPKKRSCAILHDIEQRPRGVYSGVLGYLDVGGGGAFSVVIRTAVQNVPGGEWRVGAGGAVTVQSEAEAEFAEMETKASSVLNSVRQ